MSHVARSLPVYLFVGAMLGGCALNTGKPSGVPKGSILVAEGWSPLSYKSDADGRVYVWDSADQRVAYEADLRRGQSIWLDVQSGWVMIDDKPSKDRAGQPVQVGSYVYHWLFFHPSAVDSGSDK